MRFLAQPDYAKCVIAQKAAAAPADDRRIVCGAVDMTRYTCVIPCRGPRIPAPVTEGYLLDRSRAAESEARLG